MSRPAPCLARLRPKRLSLTGSRHQQGSREREGNNSLKIALSSEVLPSILAMGLTAGLGPARPTKGQHHNSRVLHV